MARLYLTMNGEPAPFGEFASADAARAAIPALRNSLRRSRPARDAGKIMLGGWIVETDGRQQPVHEYEVFVDQDCVGIGWFESRRAARAWGLKQRGFLCEMHAELKLGRPVYVAATLNPSLAEFLPSMDDIDLDDGSSES